MSRKLISVFVMLILSVFTYGHLGLFQLARSKKYVYKPTYGPPGLITFVLRLRDSSSAWVILSRVTWYESFVAHTVILSCINPRQLSWDAPELASKTVAWLERDIPESEGKQKWQFFTSAARVLLQFSNKSKWSL